MKRWILLFPVLLFFTGVGIIEQYNWHQWFDLIINLSMVTLLFFWLLKKENNEGKWGSVLEGVFLCYLIFVHIMVTWLYIDQYFTRFQFNISLHQINLIPFKTLGNVYAITELPRVYWKQFIGNLLLLTPLGYFVLRLRIVKGAWEALIFVFLFTVGIECIQFIKSIFISGGRSTDIDDVLLNTLGGLLGIAAYYIIQKLRSFQKEKQQSVQIRGR